MSDFETRPTRRHFLLGGCAVVFGAFSPLALKWRQTAFAATTRTSNTIPNKTSESEMMTEANLNASDPTLSERARQLIRIGEDGIAKENRPALEAFFHPDFRFHGPDGSTLTREELWDYFAACRAAFDDFSVTRQQIFSDGGANVAARTTFYGIFARPFTASPIGTIQPTEEPAFYTINNVFRYAENGQLIEEWAQYDSRLLLERMGVELVLRG
ncbi:ester cyclase [Kushneria aurantia]|uniref:Ester cyclase n=1 Tax=Kushneria aurantia TaxID=504092 RepID=A0ABV6G609_9GAMM|nr:ester cyclase [Kushneria aurantia]